MVGYYLENKVHLIVFIRKIINSFDIHHYYTHHHEKKLSLYAFIFSLWFFVDKSILPVTNDIKLSTFFL